MKLYSLFFIAFLLSVSFSLHAMNAQRIAQGLALTSGMYILYSDATEPDWQLRKPFRGGTGSALIAAASMKALEMFSPAYFNTNFFTATLMGQAIKILTGATAAGTFCYVIGAYKHMAQDNKRLHAYLKGLLCGTLLVLPFCSDL